MTEKISILKKGIGIKSEKDANKLARDQKVWKQIKHGAR